MCVVVASCGLSINEETGTKFLFCRGAADGVAGLTVLTFTGSATEGLAVKLVCELGPGGCPVVDWKEFKGWKTP